MQQLTQLCIDNSDTAVAVTIAIVIASISLSTKDTTINLQINFSSVTDIIVLSSTDFTIQIVCIEVLFIKMSRKYSIPPKRLYTAAASLL